MGGTISKYFYPIPKEKLIKRFEKPFKTLAQGQSTTIVALPHTGRTSHLRFISSQPKVIKLLGLNTTNTKVCFVDIDKTTGSYESYVSEIINSILSEETGKYFDNFSYNDAYILNKQLLKLTKEITSKRKIILIVTLNEKVVPIISELDNLLVQIQKASSKYPINILFSVDTKVTRNYKQGHSSSTFNENIFYFPTFNQEETNHSLQRIALSKGKKIANTILNDSMSITGGISSLFHTLIGIIDTASSKELKNNLFSSDRIRKVMKTIKNEVNIDNKLASRLLTPKAFKFINENKIEQSSFASVKLSQTPTAQEINLLKLFVENLNTSLSRDEIAQTLWGKVWEKKYSDWAIDKAISRLRKNIITPEYKVITVKNLGYQLIKLS